MEEKKIILAEAIDLIREGHWDKAHDLVQNYEGDYQFDRLHALLHRQEGDTFNAKWWYNKLGMSVPVSSIQEELDVIKEEFQIF